jgi:hypothetical protein
MIDHTYVYTPLNELLEDSIRLLDLLPETGEAHISYQVSLARLREKPSYSALSYEWGTDTAGQIIALDERRC